MVKTEIVINNDFQKARKLFDDLNSIMVDYSHFVRLFKDDPTKYKLFNDRLNENGIDKAFLEAFNEKIVDYVNDSSEPETKPDEVDDILKW